MRQRAEVSWMKATRVTGNGESTKIDVLPQSSPHIQEVCRLLAGLHRSTGTENAVLKLK